MLIHPRENTTGKPTAFVRYIGNRVCWTTEDGRFYMGDRDELTPEEKRACDEGGKDVPLTDAINTVAT